MEKEYKVMKKVFLMTVSLLFLVSCSKMYSEDSQGALYNHENTVEKNENIATTESDEKDSVEEGPLYASSDRVINRLTLDHNKKVFAHLLENQIDVYSYFEEGNLVIKGKHIVDKKMEVPEFKYAIDELEVFGISSAVLGMNSDEGLVLHNIYIENNQISETSIDDDLSGYVGYFIETIEDIPDPRQYSSVLQDVTFVGCMKSNQNYILSICNSTPFQKVPVDGKVVDVLYLPSNMYVFAVLTDDSHINLYVMDREMNLLWKTDYKLDKGMEYGGLVVNEYDSCFMIINGQDNTGKIIKYKMSNQTHELSVDYNFSIECISDDGNTYAIGVKNQDGTHQVIVCNRNFDILDHIDLGNDPDMHFEDITFYYNSDLADKQYIGTTLCTNQERVRLILDVRNSYDSKQLIHIPKKFRVNCDPNKHITPAWDDTDFDKYVRYNFDQIKEIFIYPYTGILKIEGDIYYYCDDLITKVSNIPFDDEHLNVYKIDDEVLLFYKNDKYIGSYSVLGDEQVEAFYNQVLQNDSIIQYHYIDDEAEHILAVTKESIILLDLENQEIQKYDNTLDSSYKETLTLYYEGDKIYLYNRQFFYAFNEESQTFVESPLDDNFNYQLFIKNNDVFLYYSDTLYKLDRKDKRLNRIDIPEKLRNNVYNKFSYLQPLKNNLYWGDYIYDIHANKFIKKSHHESQPFEGIIRDKWYVYDQYGDVDSIEDVVFYKDNYLPYTINGESFALLDYKEIDDTEYFIEYGSNNLYMNKESGLIKLTDRRIRVFNRKADALVYSGFYPEDNLYLYSLSSQTEKMLFDGPVDNIYMMDGDIYFLSLGDREVFKYNLESQKLTSLTEDKEVQSFYLVGSKIAYEAKGKIYVADINNRTAMKSIEGKIVAFREKNKEFICKYNSLVFGYEIESDKYQVYDYDGYMVSVEAAIANKLLYYGESTYFVQDIEVKGLEDTVYDSYAYSLNDTFEILDIGEFMSVSIYIKNKITNEHYSITDADDIYVDGEYFVDAYILLLHDGESVYYKKVDNSVAQGFIWMKYTPGSNESIPVDSVEEEGKVIIKCSIRGA